jgi:PPOX class probable F420-dependent enzyme
MTLEMIPESHTDLLLDETRAFAFLATTMSDGSPQVTPIWFNTDGEYLLINSARGRVKDKNMRADPLVAILIYDPKDPYRYLQLRGEIVRITESGAKDHIDMLAGKYLGEPKFKDMKPGDIRVIYKFSPLHVSIMG